MLRAHASGVTRARVWCYARTRLVLRAHSSGVTRALGAWIRGPSSLIFIRNIKFSDNINNYYFIIIFIENFGPAIAGLAGPAATPVI